MAVDQEPRAQVYKVVREQVDGSLLSVMVGPAFWGIKYIPGLRVQAKHISSFLFAFDSLDDAESFGKEVKNRQIWLASADKIVKAPKWIHDPYRWVRYGFNPFSWSDYEIRYDRNELFKRFWEAQRLGLTRLEGIKIARLFYLHDDFKISTPHGTVLCNAITLQERVA